jgi:hypothetical protein
MFTFCKPISSKKRFSPHRKLDDKFSFTLFESAKRIAAEDWDVVANADAVFLNRQYLSVVEKCGNSSLKGRYVVLYANMKPCGIFYFQVLDLGAEVFEGLFSVPSEESRSARLKLFESYVASKKDEVLMRLFTLGNNLVSGNYGFLFLSSVKKEKVSELLLQITEVVSKEEKLSGTISAILLKDFKSRLKPEKLFKAEKYVDFLVEPNMIVQIPDTVKSLGEYTQLFSKKYRNRAKSIFKQGSGLERRALSLEELKMNEKEIYRLYEQVFERAKFKLLKLPKNYFCEVKKIFNERFNVSAYYLDGKMLAFNSYFVMHDDFIEAHYIGFDYDLNQEFQLYQNILYQNIEAALKHGKTKVNLGRTAAEIKTTVGAVAQDLVCYVKPQTTISKWIMNPFIRFLQPGEWTPRNPFKSES